jgi:predicted transcriptional regulator
MKRTTVKLPDEVDARLRYEAQRRNTTISRIVREAVETELGMSQPRRFMAAGVGRSGQTDVSERVEEILAEEWNR